MKRIIAAKKRVIVAADVLTTGALRFLLQDVHKVPGIGGIKLGFTMAGRGIDRAVRVVREEAGLDFPIIYDHQKAGNDVPKSGWKFAKTFCHLSIDAAIIYPFAGPVTQTEWTRAIVGEGVQVLTGGMMTHAQFLASEGGYVSDSAPERIYKLACQLGVRHFVVPGNKLEWVKRIRAWLVTELGEGNFVLYAPGFIEQGGDISECGKVAGDEWHPIVGIYAHRVHGSVRETAMAVTSQLVG